MRGDTHPVSLTDQTYLPFGPQCAQNIVSMPRGLRHPKSCYWLETCSVGHVFPDKEAFSGPSSFFCCVWTLNFALPPLQGTLILSKVSIMGSHLFTSWSGLNLGIRMRKKHQHIFTAFLLIEQKNYRYLAKTHHYFKFI
jgi:hypothetical protein